MTFERGNTKRMRALALGIDGLAHGMCGRHTPESVGNDTRQEIRKVRQEWQSGSLG